MRYAVSIFATLLLSCSLPDVSGTWTYDWQVRDDPTEAFDGHFHGLLTLAQDGTGVTGDLGYPDEDVATLYNDPTLRGKWVWPVYGSIDGDTLRLHAPAPNTAWDDPWWFDLEISDSTLSGPSYAGDSRVPRHRFTALR